MALDFVAGCIGGCAGVLVAHPLDTIKVQLQTQDPKNPRYAGMMDCAKKLYAKEKFRGFYRGLASPMGGVAVINAIVFGVYGNVQKNSSDPNSLYAHFLAGSAAGAAQSIITSPMELVKTRLQLQDELKGVQKYRGPIDCMKHVYSSQGSRGIFKGLGITAIRDLPGFAAYFVAYEVMVQHKHCDSLWILTAGGLAGMFSWLVTFPIDVIKTRMQVDGFNTEHKYSGYLDCLKKGYVSEGWRFLTRGLGTTLIRAFPMNAICFLVVDSIMSLNSKMTQPVQMEVDSQSNTEELQLTSAKHTRLIRPKFDTDMDYIYRLKCNTIKGLTLMSAFHEDSVCKAEVKYLSNLHDHDEIECIDFSKILNMNRGSRFFSDEVISLHVE